MKTTKRSAWRLPMFVGYMVVIASLLACAVLAGDGGAQAEEGSLQLNNGVVEVKDNSGDWVPVAGKATFELTGKLESSDPWTVSGKAFTTDETTKIEEGLQVGDIVRVRGTVLDDNTWVAYTVERAGEHTEPIIIMIGVVGSIDPWVVNGIQLNVTDETDIQGEITTGMIVRVKILLLPVGTWKVVSITPLGESTEASGCATVVATIISVSGDEIQFLGWPITVKFGTTAQADGSTDTNERDENTNDDDRASVGAGDVVVAVVCISDDGSLIIMQIIILDAEEGGGAVPAEGEKVLVCHKPGKNQHTLSLPPSAVPAHLGHGDTLGACP